jgi:hypothetical protein
MKDEQENKKSILVQDSFFERGNWWLKFRQIILSLFFLIVVILPILILFNSISNKKIWNKLYYWTYQDGFKLTNYLEDFIILAFVAILVCSLGFLFRINRMEQKICPTV